MVSFGVFALHCVWGRLNSLHLIWFLCRAQGCESFCLRTMWPTHSKRHRNRWVPLHCELVQLIMLPAWKRTLVFLCSSFLSWIYLRPQFQTHLLLLWVFTLFSIFHFASPSLPPFVLSVGTPRSTSASVSEPPSIPPLPMIAPIVFWSCTTSTTTTTSMVPFWSSLFNLCPTRDFSHGADASLIRTISPALQALSLSPPPLLLLPSILSLSDSWKRGRRGGKGREWEHESGIRSSEGRRKRDGSQRTDY